MDLRFDDHPRFHRVTLGMVLGAFAAGLILHPITPLAPYAGGALGIGIGAARAHGAARWRLGLVTLALVPWFVTTLTWGLMAATASVVGLALALGGPRGWRGAVTFVLGGATVFVGLWCAFKFHTAQELRSWPPVLLTGVAAAAAGMVGVLATLPRHVVISRDPVTSALRRLPRTLDAEIRDLCARAVAIWRSTRQDEALDRDARVLVRDGVVKALEVATHSARIGTGTTDADLARRIEELDARIAGATDDEVKAQYEQARSALADQRRYHGSIARGRDRLVARMHNHVSTLEKFHLAATSLPVARAAQPSDRIDELRHEVAANAEALLAAGSERSEEALDVGQLTRA